MATKPKGRTSKGNFEDDDFLESLFDDKKHPVRGKAVRGAALSRSSAADNIFSMLTEEVKQDDGDTEGSDVSAADPSDIVKNMKDMDDMDADLFGSNKKSSSALVQTKPVGNEGPKKENKAKPAGADKPSTERKKPDSAPPTSTTRNYKKFTLSDSAGDEEGLGQSSYTKDLDDPLVDLLDDLFPDEAKADSKSSTEPTKPEKAVRSLSTSPVLKSKTPSQKPSELTFDDDKDDLMDALGFDSDKNKTKKKEAPLWSSKEKTEAPQRARTRLDEILENLTSPRAAERPPTGEMKDQPPAQDEQQQQKTSAVKEPLLEEDLTFGSYQPTLGSAPEGRQSRRQSVRFSTEDVSISTPEKKSKPTTPTLTRHRNSGDWLGLKATDDDAFQGNVAEETKIPTESPKVPSSPVMERRSSLTYNPATGDTKMAPETPVVGVNRQNKPHASKSQKKVEEDDDDWLSGALSRKKASTSAEKTPKQEESGGLEDGLNEESVVSKPAASRTEDTVKLVEETSNTFPGQPSPAAQSTHKRDKRLRPVSQPTNASSAAQQQVTLSADSLQQLLLQQQQMMQSQLLSLGGVVDPGALQRLQDRENHRGHYQALQARIIQLEGQVKNLQLERDQSQMLLESVQQQHKQDIELMENTHKSRVKLLEESAAQRDVRARQECEDLIERLATVTRSAEQERSELQAQYQRKLAQAQQERDREVERLRDLQRKSILEMKRDHEDQIHRLKKLKEEEIDAVTSATSQTRSLTVVIEQMEQFSSRLGELSSRVESTHEHTAQGLEQGARHRDEQLRIMQDRLAQQQKVMAEERTYLKEIISRMDTQLNEQQRQLEKERWKMTAEQAKAECAQRALEEERRSLGMQITVEREELERAKSALLEEQKSVMQHCAEERRKLAAEWAHFHTQEKQRHQRAEREVSSLLEKREGSIMSLAQEQADLKLRTAELKQKEAAVAQEREALDLLKEELDKERERITSSALRLKTRVQEVEAFSKLASEKHEEGERALQEAKRVEAEHEARLRNIQIRTEHLRQQEQQILQERLRSNNRQEETGRRTQEAPLAPLSQMTSSDLPDPGAVLPNPELNVNLPHPALFPNSQSMTLQASLALWKYAALKDREFLEEEQHFLENLKKRSYRLSFKTD